MMSNGDPRDGFFYPILNRMMDSYRVWLDNRQKYLPMESREHTYCCLRDMLKIDGVPVYIFCLGLASDK